MPQSILLADYEPDIAFERSPSGEVIGVQVTCHLCGFIGTLYTPADANRCVGDHTHLVLVPTKGVVA